MTKYEYSKPTLRNCSTLLCRALGVAAALAFDTSYAQKIVDGGHLPKLLAALSSAVGRLVEADESSRPQEFAAIVAILGLLKRIAKGGVNLSQKLIQGGVLDTLDECLQQIDIDTDSDVAAGMCGVLSSICKDEATAQLADEKDLIAKVFKLIDENAHKDQFGFGALEFAAALSSFEAMHERLIELSAFEVCASALKYHKDSSPYQVSLILKLLSFTLDGGSGVHV